MPTPLQIVIQQSLARQQQDAFDQQQVAMAKHGLNDTMQDIAGQVRVAPVKDVRPALSWDEYSKESAGLVKQEAGANQHMQLARQQAEDKARLQMALADKKAASEAALVAFKDSLKLRRGGPKTSAAMKYMEWINSKPPENTEQAQAHAKRGVLLYNANHPKDREAFIAAGAQPHEVGHGSKETTEARLIGERARNRPAPRADQSDPLQRALQHEYDRQAQIYAQQIKDAPDDETRQ